MIEFDCEEVKRQLNRLADALPEDDVDIWICKEDSGLHYTAYIKSRTPLPSVIESRDSPVGVVDAVLKTAGARGSQDKIKAKRRAIEKARDELAKLESELDPLIMAMDKAKEENPT